MPELDIREKFDPITEMSNRIQSFIFKMAFYMPVSIFLIICGLFDQKYFPWVLAIMDCFFNTAFYYFSKWPYDRYNVAFLEANMSYAVGFGAFVSILTDALLPSSVAVGSYLILSQWMIINALCFSPPEIEFNSFGDILMIFKGDERKKMHSAYNIHRKKLRGNKNYRIEIMKNCIFMTPFFKLTAKINNSIQQNLFKRSQEDQDSLDMNLEKQT